MASTARGDRVKQRNPLPPEPLEVEERPRPAPEHQVEIVNARGALDAAGLGGPGLPAAGRGQDLPHPHERTARTIEPKLDAAAVPVAGHPRLERAHPLAEVHPGKADEVPVLE